MNTNATDAPGEIRSADLRLLAPALAVWAVMWLVTGWAWGIWVGIGLVAVCSVVVLWLRRSTGQAHHRHHVRQASLVVAGVAIMATASVVVGGMRQASLTHGPLAHGADRGSVIEAEVVIRTTRLSPTWGMAVVNATCQRAVIAGQTYRFHQPVVVMVPSSQAEQWMGHPAGSVIAVTARLSPSATSDGTAAVLSVLGESEVIRGPPTWQRVIESMRAGLVQAVQGNPSEQAALVPALVVGDTSAMPISLTDDFRATGLTHLTAVSGANLAILLAFLGAIARLLGVRGHWLTVVSVIGIAVFVALCHSEPSVLRATAMGVVALAAVGRGGGTSSGLRGLCLAVIGLCLIDPWMSRSVGFVLSVLACAGIIAWGRRWTRLLERWLPTWAAEAMTIPLAAQVATQPVVSWLSGAVSVSGLLANAAAGPWVAPATVVGLVAALISPISPLVASWAGYVAGWCAQPILTIGHGLASLPGASHPWPTTIAGMAVVTAGSAVVVLVIPLLLRRAWMVLALTAVLVAAMLAPPFQPGWPGQHWRVAACDVGQGDAVVVRVGTGQAIMIDVGPAQSAVVQCLGQLGVAQIPLLVLTHFHADHAGAFAEVLDAVVVGSLLVPDGGGDASAVLHLADQRGIPVVRGRTGLTTSVGDATLKVVSAWRGGGLGDSDGGESSTENDESLILRVDTPEMSLLDTGDIELAGQQAGLADPSALRVDVLKVPHHGSARQDPAFIAATGARVALVGVGADNTYGHPAARTVKELVNNGMEVVRTDVHGSIALANRNGWSVTTQK